MNIVNEFPTAPNVDAYRDRAQAVLILRLWKVNHVCKHGYLPCYWLVLRF